MSPVPFLWVTIPIGLLKISHSYCQGGVLFISPHQDSPYKPLNQTASKPVAVLRHTPEHCLEQQMPGLLLRRGITQTQPHSMHLPLIPNSVFRTIKLKGRSTLVESKFSLVKSNQLCYFMLSILQTY